MKKRNYCKYRIDAFTILGTRTCWVLVTHDSSSTPFARLFTFQRSSHNLTNGKGSKYFNGSHHLDTTCYWIHCITEDHKAPGKEVSSSPVSFMGGKMIKSSEENITEEQE